MRRKWYLIVPAAIAGMVLFASLGGAVVRLLWNWLTPSLFGWPHITFWQALGLLALCRILVGGFGMRGGNAYRRRNGRWERMTPEERERMRQTMRDRCGFPPEETVDRTAQ